MRIRTKLIIKNYELEERRKNLKYTQADLASIIGMSLNEYQLIESMKKKPTGEIARSLSIELDAAVEVLFPKGYEDIVDVLKPNKRERIITNDRMLDKMSAKQLTARILKDSPLTEKELLLIELRNGINKYAPETLDGVAKKFGVTRERIRQIEAKTLEKLRSHYENLTTEVDPKLKHIGEIYTNSGGWQQRKVIDMTEDKQVTYSTRDRAADEYRWGEWAVEAFCVCSYAHLRKWGDYEFEKENQYD